MKNGCETHRLGRGNTGVLNGGRTAKSTAIVLCCGLLQTGQKHSIPVGAALSVPECVLEFYEKLEQPLDACVVISFFTYAFHLSSAFGPKNCEISCSIGSLGVV